MQFNRDFLGLVFTKNKMILIGFLSKTNSEVYKIFPILDHEIDNLFILNLTKILTKIEKFIFRYNLLEVDTIIVLDGGLLQEIFVLNFPKTGFSEDNIVKINTLDSEKFKEKFPNYIWSESELLPEIFEKIFLNKTGASFEINSNLQKSSSLISSSISSNSQKISSTHSSYQINYSNLQKTSSLNFSSHINYIAGVPHYIQFQYYLIVLKLSLNLVGITTLFTVYFKTLEIFFQNKPINDFETNFLKRRSLFNLRKTNFSGILENSLNIDNTKYFGDLEVNQFKFYIEKIIKQNNYFQSDSIELFYRKGLFLLRDL